MRSPPPSISSGGWSPQVIQVNVLDGPCQRAMVALTNAPSMAISRIVWWIASTAACEVAGDLALGAEGAEGDGSERGGGRAVAHAVGDAEPGAVAVLDVVEPVAADLVAGQDVAGDSAPVMRAMRGGSRFCWISAAGLVSLRRRAMSKTSV